MTVILTLHNSVAVTGGDCNILGAREPGLSDLVTFPHSQPLAVGGSSKTHGSFRRVLLFPLESGPSGLVLQEHRLGQLNIHQRRCRRGPRSSGVGVAGRGLLEASRMPRLLPCPYGWKGCGAAQALLLHLTRCTEGHVHPFMSPFMSPKAEIVKPPCSPSKSPQS